MRIRTSIFILAFAGKMVAQDSLRTTRLGIGCFFSRPGYYSEAVYPSVIFTYGKHGIKAGLSYTYQHKDHNRLFNGMQAAWTYYPLGLGKRLNLVFENQLSYVRGSYTQDFNRFSAEPGPNKVSRKVSIASLDNYLCFGFRWNISKRLFFNLVYGQGFGFYKEDYTYTFSDGNVYSASGGLYPRILSLDSRFISAGLGFDFYKHIKQN